MEEKHRRVGEDVQGGAARCAYKRVCLENTVLIVQYLNINMWGFTHLY